MASTYECAANSPSHSQPCSCRRRRRWSLRPSTSSGRPSSPGSVSVSVDSDTFGVEIEAVDLDVGRFTYFHPYLVLQPTVAVGLSHIAELKFVSVFQPATRWANPFFFIDPGRFGYEEMWI